MTFTPFKMVCPHCGAEDDDTYEVVSGCNPNGGVEAVLTCCFKCDRDYVAEVSVDIYVRPLTQDEAARVDRWGEDETAGSVPGEQATAEDEDKGAAQ